MAVTASNFSPAARANALALAQGGFASISVDSVDGSIPAGGTGAAAGGYDTAPNRDTMLATVTEMKATVNATLTALGVTQS